MSGHSKWNNIKRKKEKTDGARAKVFTKIGREISVAVRTGGPNPASNSKLADLIAKAKRMSVPNDNIQRIIKKAEGGDKTEYEAITYEGYGPGGVAVMVETLTDNRNRPAPLLRQERRQSGRYGLRLLPVQPEGRHRHLSGRQGCRRGHDGRSGRRCGGFRCR